MCLGVVQRVCRPRSRRELPIGVFTDREARVLYLHVLGIRDRAGVEAQRRSVLRWEARIVRAVGSKTDLAALRGVHVDVTRGAGR